MPSVHGRGSVFVPDKPYKLLIMLKVYGGLPSHSSYPPRETSVCPLAASKVTGSYKTKQAWTYMFRREL